MTEGGTRLKGAGYYIRLLERRNPRNIGYDLYSHRKFDTRLVIRLVKESDCTFDRELVEADFTKSLQDCLRHASVGLELKCSYANNRVMIGPFNDESKNFLAAYRIVVLDREKPEEQFI